jgi:carbonic anhydrase/acetyltransferase-like protein (isoleucine patch superfamily)
VCCIRGTAYAGDINAIKIGNRTNIQDNAIIHVAKHSLDSSSSSGGQPKPTIIGNSVTVGHGATLHACTIGDGCLVSVQRVGPAAT